MPERDEGGEAPCLAPAFAEYLGLEGEEIPVPDQVITGTVSPRCDDAE